MGSVGEGGGGAVGRGGKEGCEGKVFTLSAARRGGRHVSFSSYTYQLRSILNKQTNRMKRHDSFYQSVPQRKAVAGSCLPKTQRTIYVSCSYLQAPLLSVDRWFLRHAVCFTFDGSTDSKITRVSERVSERTIELVNE